MPRLERPAQVTSRCSALRIGSTIAVDDSASAKPMVSATGQPKPPTSASAPAMIVPVASTCALPSPKTSRRITRSRSNDSSSPIANISSTIPISP